jgi:hypothetical protein
MVQGIFGLLMVFFFIMRVMFMEKEVGTVSFFLQYTLIAFMIQCTYLLLAFGIGFLYGPAKETSSFGIWPLYLWIITSDAFKNPNRA